MRCPKCGHHMKEDRVFASAKCINRYCIEKNYWNVFQGANGKPLTWRQAYDIQARASV